MGDSTNTQAYKVGYHASEYKDSGLPYDKSPTRPSDPNQHENEAGKSRQVDAVSSALSNPDLQIYERFIAPARQFVNEWDLDLERGRERLGDGLNVPATPGHHPVDGAVERYHIMDSWGERGTGDGHQFYFNSAKHKTAAGNPIADGTVEWVHLGFRSPTLGVIQSVVDKYACSGLEDGIDRLTDGLLRRMFSNQEKTFVAGYYLQPGVIRYDGKLPLQDVPDKPCTFVNFPYLCLEDPIKLDELPEEPDPVKRKFPVRSLLQSRYRLQLTHEKDLKQSVSALTNRQVNACIQPAVAHLGSSTTTTEKCTKIVHAHQLWCLSLSGDTVVTCAPIHGETLHGQVILVNEINQEDPTVHIVLDYKGRLKRYRYQRNHCDSWFRLLNKHRQILLSKGLFGDKGVQNEQFDLFFQDEKTKETELTWSNWLEILQTHNSSNLEITIRKTSISNTPGISLAGATASGQTSQTLQIPKPIQQGVADPQIPAVKKEMNKSSEMRRLNQLERTAINAGQEQTSQAHVKGGGSDIVLDSPSKPSPEEFANSLGSDKRHIIPFFQWRLRKNTQKGTESTRVGRSRIVLNRIQPSLFETYRELFYDGDLILNELNLESLTQLSKLEGRTLEQFAADTEDGSPRGAQIETLIKATSAVLPLFLPNIIDQNVQREPLSPLTQDGGLKPADIQSPSAGNSNPTGNPSDQGGGPATNDPSAGKNQEPSHRPGTANTETNTKTDDKDVPPGMETHPTLKLFRAVIGGVILFLKGTPIPEEDFNKITRSLRTIHRVALFLHLGVRSLSGMQEYDSDPEFGGSAILQRIIVKAFIHIIYMYFGLWQSLWARKENEAAPERQLFSWALGHADDCAKKLHEAANDLIAEAGEFEKEPPHGPMVTPEAVIIMLLDRLSQNVHGVGSFDLEDIYERVIEKLAADVEYNATRSLLFEINKTSEELDIVRDVLKQQERVLLLYRKSLDPGTFSKGKAGIEREKRFPYEERSVSAVLKTVRERISDFDELRNRITQLRTQNVQLVETQQDENNKAILVFTRSPYCFFPCRL
ncbi:uncharacterized protein Z520_06351 [Fonsecaea multimorphosa CBS 102226]|uniref:Uncharacterized protein n=1 Tax=Fonsecaea multimorphosa CBS 102226 TaxID=1442371 RepID=A0A0D2IMK8_9EURO|nr:uncharacterized protein Z520_06351 [Fonsecaea multimorphosa CBS 102226]KIX98271.1 hypothetical protein Z520_06351 [Fonsecaea multimorphosa CBS 102226]OAL22596.1 hypothetical protein AYO22_07154 [Fonsecaea multimorphosa]